MEGSVSGAGALREPDDIFAGHDISWIAEHVADPAHHSGGVVIAAITMAGASAAAELVLNLAVRRKSNASSREEIEAAIARVRDLREQFLLAADEDMAAFERLLEVQRAKREGRPGAEDQLSEAYLGAAVSPVELGEAGLDLMQIVYDHLRFGTRFTVSDMGAAAALAHGAIDASLLTAETNIALAAEAGAELKQRANELHVAATKLDREIQQEVRARIGGGQ